MVLKFGMTAGNICGFFFNGVIIFFFLSLPVEQSYDSGSQIVLRFGGGKKRLDVSLELLYSSESYVSSFGIFLI